MRVFPLLVLFLLIFPTNLALADSSTFTDKDIKALLDSASEGDIVTLKAGIYVISNQVVIPEGVTLCGSVSVNGDLLTKLIVETDSNFGHQVSFIYMETGSCLDSLELDGNAENQANVPIKKGKKTGNGYGNAISSQGESDLEVKNCYIHNLNGDGFRVNRCKNVSFHDNFAEKAGHDVFYQLRSEGIYAYNNTISTFVNSALRAMSCSHARWYNNYIYAVGKGTGLAMQIQHDGATMEDFEVCNNYIVTSYGPGLWLVDKTGNYEELWLHDNVFLDCGYNDDIYWVGGIIANGYDNALIENNVFDGCYLGGASFWLYANGWDVEATTTFKNNIFTNSRAGDYSNVGGWGINNEISQQTVVTDSNCFYNNEAGDVRGCTLSSTDYFTDPKSEPTTCNIKWDGTQWVIPGGNPTPIGEIEGVYDDLPDPSEEELEEFEFNSIFDVFQMEFSDSGHIEQGEIRVINPEWEKKGKYTEAYIYLAGFEDQIVFDNTTYIPGKPSECAIIKVDTKNLAKRPTDQSYDLKITDKKDGSMKVTVKVKTEWEEKVKKYKKGTVLGKTVKIPYYVYEEKHESVKYEQIYTDVPETFPVLNQEDIKVTVEYQNNSLNPHATVTIDSKSEYITGTVYTYNGSEAREYNYIGYVNQSSNGFKSSNFEKTLTWKFSDDLMSYSYQGLYIKGEFDPAKFSMTVTTPYDEFEVKDFNYVEKGDPFKKKVNFTPFIIVLVLFAVVYPFWSSVKLSFGRMR